MADNPASATDLQNRSLRTLTAREAEVGATLLGDAFTMVTAAKPSVTARLDKLPRDLVFTALVRQIVCAMVLRVLNNPDGKLEEQGDDYRYRLDAAVSTGALYVSTAELARLAEGDAVTDGAFTIRPSFPAYGRGYWSDSTTWVPQ